MNMNELQYVQGSRIEKTRRRGGSKGKTCGRGHKGQKARSGSSIPANREGGQTPLYRRLPKFGFTSKIALTHARLPLRILNKIPDELAQHVSIALLKALDLIPSNIQTVKIYASGTETRAFVISEEITLTKGVVAALAENSTAAGTDK